MDVLMPQLGETVAEGKITKWFKAAGDKVAPGDNLFEIETDKVSMISDGGAALKAAPATAPAALPPPKAPAAPRALAPVAALAAPVPSRPVALDPFREVRSPERNFGPAKL